MDPVSVVGITSSTAALLKVILETFQGLQTALRDIKSIDVNTQGLIGEVDAFHLVLRIFQKELQTSNLLPEVRRWWNAGQLDGLLRNAKKTLLRLDAIAKEVGKQRSVLSALRQYWTSKGYDKEFQHLRLRIGTFVTALRIPIELARIHTIRQDLAFRNPDIQNVQTDTSSQRQMDSLAVQFLGDRVNQLEESIQTLSRNLESFQDQGSMAVLPSNMRKESEQLIDIAHSLTQSTVGSSAQISDGSSVQAPTIVQVERHEHDLVNIDDEIGYASSLHGVPIGAETGKRINAWISAISSATAPIARDFSGAFSEISIDKDPTHSKYTAPSTVQRSLNLQAQLAQARLKKAQSLMAAEKFREAIPHFQRSIEKLKANPDYFKPEITDRYLQLNLAKAMFNCYDHRKMVESLLRSVLDNSESSSQERSEAAHNFASLLSETDDTRLEEARDLCESAAEIRAEVFGQDDPKTYRTFALMAFICRKLHDPDEQLWEDMLPDSYEIPPYPVETLAPPLTKGSKLIVARFLSSNGNLVALTYPSSGDHKMRRLSYNVERLNISLEAAAWKEELLLLSTPDYYKYLGKVMAKQKAITISPDGALFGVACPRVMVINTESDMFRMVLSSQDSKATLTCALLLLDSTSALAFSNDGELLALAYSPKNLCALAIYSTSKWVVVSHTNSICADMVMVRAMAFSPDSKLLALAGIDKSKEHSILVYNHGESSVLWRLQEHNDEITNVVFSPDGHLLATAGPDRKAINILDAKSNQLLREIEIHPHIILDMIFLSGGQVLRVAGLKDEMRIQIQEFEIGSCRFSVLPDKAQELADKAKEGLPDVNVLDGLEVGEGGEILGPDGTPLGEITEGNPEDLVGGILNENGEILDVDGDVIGRAEVVPDSRKLTKKGTILDDEGEVISKLTDDSDPKKYAGKVLNGKGLTIDDEGDIVGRVEVI